MPNYEKIKLIFSELKNLPEAEAIEHSLKILELYIFLEKGEQNEIVDSLYRWTELNVHEKPLLFAYARLTKAFSLYYREQYDEALPLLGETQHIFIELNDLNGAAICSTIQGSMYRTFGNVDLALKSLWSAHEQLNKSEKYQHFFMASCVTIGGIYLEMKHYQEAVPLFQNTLELSQKTEKYYWMIYSLHGLGKVYLMQKNYPEAKEQLEQAMRASEKFNSPLSISNSLSELGNYYFTMGDFFEAEQFHKRALTIRELHQFFGGAVTSCIRLGEIYIKQSKANEAVGILEKGLKMAEQIKVKPKMYQIHFLLSEIYQDKNELEKCLFHYKIYHDLHQQVELEDNVRKIKNAHLVFEAEQTKKENIIIKKQKEEIECKNIELQETIDELTLARVGKKARAITLVIAIFLFIFEDLILHLALSIVPADNYFISLVVKMVIIFSLSPINKAVEHYLLKRIIKKRKRDVLV